MNRSLQTVKKNHGQMDRSLQKSAKPQNPKTPKPHGRLNTKVGKSYE